MDTALDSSCFDVPEDVSEKRICSVMCEVCCAMFPSAQELGPHMFERHTSKSVLRIKIDTTHGHFCSEEFRTRARLHDHISFRSKNLSGVLSILCSYCDPDATSPLEEAAAARENITHVRLQLLHPIRAFQFNGPCPAP